MQLTNINTVRDLMNKHGMTFSKALGQNFLINPSVCPRMAELGGADEHTGVIEIGPGVGVLTAELAKRAKKVVCIELDKRLLPILDETLEEFDNVKVIQGDVLDVDLKELIKTEFAGMDVVICANLPYYITSPIIMKLLEDKIPIKSITAMVQKEAGERICAPLPSREVGALTVSIAYYAQAQILFSVSKGSFMPAPKIDSSVIRLDIHTEPPTSISNKKAFFRTVKAAFSQRRKTLSNSLSSGLGISKSDANQLLENAGLSPQLRAEQLAFDEFVAIANEFAKTL